jgi:hypothetical protein
MKLPAVLFACAALSSAATYYVSPSGSDRNNGSSTAPFLTVSQAVAVVSAGDTIILRDGTYGSEGSTWYPISLQKAGSSSAWITIQAEHRGQAILDCQNTEGTAQTTSNGCMGYIYATSSAAYWKLTGLVFTRGWETGMNIWGANHLVLQNCEFRNIAQNSSGASYGYEGIYIDSGDSITIDGCYFHDIGRTGHGGDHGIYTHGANSRITNSIFQRPIPGYEIQAAANFSGVIEGNTFAFPSGQGSYGEIVLWGALGDVIIHNNIFYNPINSAVHEDSSDVSVNSCLIDNNIIYGVSNSQDRSVCTVSNSKFVNPQFVNSTTAPYDFHIQATSPAVNSAVAGLGLTYDYDGNHRPVGTANDIGAFEYQTTSGTGTATSTSLISSNNPTVSGQSATFTASVISSSGTPTGSVTFLDGSSSLGTVSLIGDTAVLGTSALSTGSHSITANYSGDSTHSSSTSEALTEIVNPQPAAATSTSLVSSRSPAVYGQSVTFTASVTSNSGTPTGSVTFRDGGTARGTASLSGNTAVWSTSALSTGSHSITASYGGDSTHSSSSSPVLTEVVSAPASNSTVTTLSSSANPVRAGRSVTFTAVVKPVSSGTGAPTGTVVFYDGTTRIGTATVSGSSAAFTTSLSKGQHSISASYAGNSTFAASKSAVLVENVLRRY